MHKFTIPWWMPPETKIYIIMIIVRGRQYGQTHGMPCLRWYFLLLVVHCRHVHIMAVHNTFVMPVVFLPWSTVITIIFLMHYINHDCHHFNGMVRGTKITRGWLLLPHIWSKYIPFIQYFCEQCAEGYCKEDKNKSQGIILKRYKNDEIWWWHCECNSVSNQEHKQKTHGRVKEKLTPSTGKNSIMSTQALS